jgi:hypothetical protein
MRAAVVLAVGLSTAVAAHAADGRGNSTTTTLQVAATVVSTCAIDTSSGRIDYRCARGVGRPVRAGNDTAPVSVPSRPPATRSTSAPGLVTIDF